MAQGGATYFRRADFEVRPKKGRAVIFFPGTMDMELDTDALHAGMPAVDVKYVSQVWIRQSFREDGQPSSPVSIEQQTIDGPLHEGVYAGHAIAGDDLHEAVLTFDDALALAKAHPACQGFTYQSADRRPSKPTRVWFKSRLRVLHADGWYTYSVGKQK